MKCIKVLTNNGNYMRVFDERDGMAFVLDVTGMQMPKWVEASSLFGWKECEEEELIAACNLPKPSDVRRQSERADLLYAAVTNVLPTIQDTGGRMKAVEETASEYGISVSTLKRCIHAYLCCMDKCALYSKPCRSKPQLTDAQKLMKKSLNKWYYSSRRLSLRAVYEHMLASFYTDENGRLFDEYPSYDAFLYFHRKNADTSRELITREGMSAYKRDSRPLLGGSVAAKYPTVGACVMIDTTTADVYVIDEAGAAVRPMILAAVDACSGMCVGIIVAAHSQSRQVVSLVRNIVEDKVDYCRSIGIEITESEWPASDFLPLVLCSDQGSEYSSAAVECLTQTGMTVQLCMPYRPDQKSVVERFFGKLQELYKPSLYGHGTVYADSSDRGAPDYSKDACLTLADFERIVVNAVLHCNNGIVREKYPYTSEMIDDEIIPTACGIWTWKKEHGETSFLEVPDEFDLMCLPLTDGVFTREGLKVNGFFYRYNLVPEKAYSYTNRYLDGGTVAVLFDPELVDSVWLPDDGQGRKYVRFDLIDETFKGMSFEQAVDLKRRVRTYVNSFDRHELQSKLTLLGILDDEVHKANKGGDS